MTTSNAAFTGSIPETYDRYLGPLLFEAHAVDLAARLEPAASAPRVLELAAGSGIVTRHLRDRLPGATIVATDLNPAMFEVGRQRLGEGPRLEWRQADACDLPFPDRSFDAVVCQFGLMFFPDQPKSASEALRVLRPGGQILYSVWDSLEANPLGKIAHETIASFFPSDPPTFYLVPFGLHDKAAIRELFQGAGFEDIVIETVPIEAHAPSADYAAFGLVRGNPVLAAIQERGGDPDAIVAALAKALAARFGSAPLRAPRQAHVIAARRPQE